MTGHGRAVDADQSASITVEVSSVNRKQLDVVTSMPRDLSILESRLRESVATIVHRGRVSISIAVSHANGLPDEIIDLELAKNYMLALRKLSRELGIDADVSLGDILRLPGVARAGEKAYDAEALWPLCRSALVNALIAMDRMRVREGAALRKDLSARGVRIGKTLKLIARANAGAIRERRESLIRKLTDLGITALGDERVMKEVMLHAERADIAEEVARIESHLDQFRLALQSEKPTGRQLDFLIQELSREFHTLGAKTASPEASQSVIECKLEIERIREQVQNIE